jgi:hypothetical protein
VGVYRPKQFFVCHGEQYLAKNWPASFRRNKADRAPTRVWIDQALLPSRVEVRRTNKTHTGLLRIH